MIVDNDGTDAVVGTFAGLPEGSTLVLGGQQVKISYVGGDGDDVTLQFVGPYVSPVIVTGPSQTASQTAGYATQTANLLRASSSDPALANPASPVYAQAQAGRKRPPTPAAATRAPCSGGAGTRRACSSRAPSAGCSGSALCVGDLSRALGDCNGRAQSFALPPASLPVREIAVLVQTGAGGPILAAARA